MSTVITKDVIEQSKQEAKEMAKILTHKDRGPNSKFVFTWKPNWFTKCHILRAKNYFLAKGKPDGKGKIPIPWKFILDSMVGSKVPKKWLIEDKYAKKRSDGNRPLTIKNKNRASMISNINKWDPIVVVTNYITCPLKYKVPGGGAKDSIPEDIKIATWQKLSHMSNSDSNIYFNTMFDIMGEYLRSAGYKVFTNSSEKEEYELQIQKLKQMAESDNNNTNNDDKSTPISTFDKLQEDALKYILNESYPGDAYAEALNELKTDSSDNNNEIEDEKQEIEKNENETNIKFKNVTVDDKCVLLDRNKVNKFIRKYYIKTFNSEYSTYYNPAEVKAKQFKSLVIVFAVQMILPIDYISTRDQSMMFHHDDRLQKYITHDKRERAGKKKISGARQTYTHSPLLSLHIPTQQPIIGPTLAIIESKNGKPTEAIISQLKEYGLKIGMNEHVGQHGLFISVSNNGWQQEYNMKDDIECVTKFVKNIVLTDGWSLFKKQEWIDGLLEKCCFPVVQPPNCSGVTGILDLSKQHLDKVDLRNIQRNHQINGPLHERKTASGNAKAGNSAVQMKFIAEMTNDQCKNIKKYGTLHCFYESNYGLNPSKRDHRDKHSFKNMIGKSSGAFMKDKHCLKRYDFFPGALSPSQAIEISENQDLWTGGKRLNDVGKTSRGYGRQEIDELGLLWAADNPLMANKSDDNGLYLSDVRSMAMDLKNIVIESCGFTGKSKDELFNKESFRKTYNCIVHSGKWNFHKEFHKRCMIRRDNIEPVEYSSPDDLLIPFALIKDKKEKAFARKILKQNNIEQVAAGRIRYGASEKNEESIRVQHLRKMAKLCPNNNNIKTFEIEDGYTADKCESEEDLEYINKDTNTAGLFDLESKGINSIGDAKLMIEFDTEFVEDNTFGDNAEPIDDEFITILPGLLNDISAHINEDNNNFNVFMNEISISDRTTLLFGGCKQKRIEKPKCMLVIKSSTDLSVEMVKDVCKNNADLDIVITQATDMFYGMDINMCFQMRNESILRMDMNREVNDNDTMQNDENIDLLTDIAATQMYTATNDDNDVGYEDNYAMNVDWDNLLDLDPNELRNIIQKQKKLLDICNDNKKRKISMMSLDSTATTTPFKRRKM